MLGEDAEQFATTQDHVADSQNDAGDDLLGDAETAPAAAPEEIAGFESSFPAVEPQNEVRLCLDCYVTDATQETDGRLI